MHIRITKKKYNWKYYIKHDKIEIGKFLIKGNNLPDGGYSAHDVQTCLNIFLKII